jgi:hypothetical protein
LTAGYSNGKDFWGNCNRSGTLLWQFPQVFLSCRIRPSIREIRGKAVAVSVAVSDPITEIRGKHLPLFR